MTKIYKYTFPEQYRQGMEIVFKLPLDALIVHFAEQDTHTFWAIVDIEQPFVARRFQVVGTGQLLPKKCTYHGTYQCMLGFVWHLIELTNSQQEMR